MRRAIPLVAAGWVAAEAYTPQTPTAGWTYYIEAVRASAWPQCAYRFLSYPDACNSIDMWMGAGGNQEFTLVPAPNGHFYLQTRCGSYVSVSGDCGSMVVDTWPQAGINQEFEFVRGDNPNMEWYLRSVGRQAAGCDHAWMSFPGPCTTSSPDKVDLWTGAGVNQRFQLHPVRSQAQHDFPPAANGGCADPFMWWSSGGASLVCTGGNLALYRSGSLSSGFARQGDALGGAMPPWAQDGNRWAPENIEFSAGGQTWNALFFADVTPSSGGKHRVGWVMSTSAQPGSWTQYAADTLNLGGSAGGDIDPHVFRDTDGRTYLVWKTDDNAVNDPVTRIWAQEISLAPGSVTLVGDRRVLMDSTGLWWVDSWVPGGSLIEGPEIVKSGGMYYLFFASGRYCQDSYAEGVARSSSFWGPYQKLGVPLLSTGTVGHSGGQKLVGPGHASFAKDPAGLWYIMWHASPGENCNRQPFVSRLVFGPNGWPVVHFADALANATSVLV